MIPLILPNLLFACATRYDNTAHGGGSLHIVVEPSDPMVDGIRLDATFAGATRAELDRAAEEGVGASEGAVMLTTSNERGTAYTDGWLSVYGAAQVTGTACSLDTVQLIASSYSDTLQLLVDDGDVGDVTTFLQDLPLAEPLGPSGSLSGTLALRVQPFSGFEEVAPCWGPDPVDHDIAVEWNLDESVEWTNTVPWDPTPLEL